MLSHPDGKKDDRRLRGSTGVHRLYPQKNCPNCEETGSILNGWSRFNTVLSLRSIKRKSKGLTSVPDLFEAQYALFAYRSFQINIGEHRECGVFRSRKISFTDGIQDLLFWQPFRTSKVLFYGLLLCLCRDRTSVRN